MVMNISHGLFHLGASLSWLLRGNVKDFNVVIFIDAGSERTGDGVVGQRIADIVWVGVAAADFLDGGAGVVFLGQDDVAFHGHAAL